MLLGFAHHPLVELLSTRSEGLPHLNVGPIDHEDDQAPILISWPDGSTTSTGVSPASNYLTLTENHLRSHPSAERDEVLRVLLLADAAKEFGADAFVTGSDALLDPTQRSRLARDSNAMTVESAVAVVGLYLRLRNDFTYRQDNEFRERFNRRLYFWVLTRELLPNAWRWTDAGGQHSQATGDDTTLQLSLSALKRVDHALRARDRVHEQMKLPQNNDTADEALFHLDTFLVFFVSAFDAVAQAAHLIYGLDPGKLHLAGWRRKWRTKQLSIVAPQVSALMDDGAPARDALDLLAFLRNTIHGEALSTVARQAGGRPLENVLLLPRSQEQALLSIIARHGGNDRWGIRPLPKQLTGSCVRNCDGQAGSAQARLLTRNSASVPDDPSWPSIIQVSRERPGRAAAGMAATSSNVACSPGRRAPSTGPQASPYRCLWWTVHWPPGPRRFTVAV
jgi:hypothetical protein